MEGGREDGGTPGGRNGVAAAWAVAVIAFVAVMLAFVFAEDKATRFFSAIGSGAGGVLSATHTFIKTEMGIPPFIVYGGVAALAYAAYVWTYQCENYRKVRGFIKVYNDWNLVHNNVTSDKSTFSKLFKVFGVASVAGTAVLFTLAPPVAGIGASVQVTVSAFIAFLQANATGAAIAAAGTAAVAMTAEEFGDTLKTLKEAYSTDFKTWLESEKSNFVLDKHGVNKDDMLNFMSQERSGFLWGKYETTRTSYDVSASTKTNISQNPGCNRIGIHLDTINDLSETCNKNLNDPNCMEAFITVLATVMPNQSREVVRIVGGVLADRGTVRDELREFIQNNADSDSIPQ